MPAVGAAIAAAWTAFTASTVGVFLTTHIVGRLIVSAGASLLVQHLTRPRLDTSPVGFPQGVTLKGGTSPCRFPLGRSMTGGQHVCPPMTHGKIDKTPNAYMTYVILLSNVPGVSLEQVIINDEVVVLGATPHPSYGQPVLGDNVGYAWVKYYDGTQTVADPHLVATYGSYPKRPWTAQMIGRGLCYAIVTMRWSDKVWGGGHPRVRFVLSGIPLYDIRKDSTAGGSGSHRWSNRATWTPSNNPFVQIYNVKRGITLADGDVWGGAMAALSLDTASFAAAMNECDRLVAAPTGYPADTQFASGLEVTVDRAPADYERELLKASSGEVVDMGGTWKARAGGAGLPIFFFTDEDAVVTRPQDFNPFPGLESSFNAVTATYPDPDTSWEPKDAPPRYNATWEAEDRGRRKVAHVEFAAVSNRFQVQRLMKAYIAEERRFRRHGLTLPPRAAVIEPLDTVSWTSTANGYIDKRFQVGEVSDDLATCLQRVALRERDPSDYDYPAELFLPSEAGASGPVRPPAQGVPNWAVIFDAIKDAGGTNRRPALRVSWDGSEQDDVTGVEWQVRLPSSGAIIAQGSTQSVDAGELTISTGILPNTTYESRARLIAPRNTDWSSWAGATTGNVGIKDADFEAGSVFNLLRALNMTVPEIVSALPGSGNFAGRFVYLTTNRKFYRHTGSPAGASGFTVEVDGGDILAGTITAAAIAAGAITADKIAAGEVFAEKLSVLARNLVNPVSITKTLVGWGGVKEDGTGGNAAQTFHPAYGLVLTTTGAIGTRSRTFQVDHNAIYRISLKLFTPSFGAGTYYVGLSAFGASAEGIVSSGNLAGNQLLTPYSPSRVPGSPAANRYFVSGAPMSVAVGLKTHVLYAIGANRDIRDCPAHSGDADQPYLKLSPDAAWLALRVLHWDNGGVSRDLMVADVSITEVGTGQIVADNISAGAVTAGAIDTTSLTAAGLAVFGGALQSDDYVAGVSGWRIGKTGSAQFQNLLVRGSLQDGAVSDIYQDFFTTAISLTTTDVEQLVQSLGAQAHGTIFKRALSFEARAVTGGNTIVQLQRRERPFAGDPYSAWTTIETWTVTDTNWGIYRDTGNLCGAFNGFQYRLLARVTVASAATCLRNSYLTIDRTTK